MKTKALPPRLKKHSIVTMVIAVFMVLVLYFANITLADTPDEVDVGEIEDGTPFTKKWSSFVAAGLDLVNLTPGYILMTFDNGSGSQVTYGGRNIGVITEDETSSFIVSIESQTKIEVRFQAITDMEVTITWYEDEQVEVPEGGLYIDGYPKAEGHRYKSQFEFDGTSAYAVNISTVPEVEHVGLVNGSIARYSWGSTDYDLRNDTGGTSLAFISHEVKYYHAKLLPTTYQGGNHTTPTNANESVSMEDGVVEIEVTSAELTQHGYDVYLPESITVAEGITRGFTVETETPLPTEYTVTTYYCDITLEYETTTLLLKSGSNILNVTGKYRMNFTNFWNESFAYPDIENTMPSQIFKSVKQTDNDRDGFPEIDLMFGDYEISNKGGTITELSTYEQSPDLIGGTQPDEDDSDPNSPNEAADMDNETLSNLWEVMRFGTDPLNDDTDGDSTNDYYDTLNNEFDDVDDDGLNDAEELGFNTNPLARDTDGDGFEDGAEITYWTRLGYNISSDIDSDGSPNVNDTYSDLGALGQGASDYSYYYDKDGIEFLLLGTNTTLRDTDGDGTAYIMTSSSSATSVTMSDGKEAEKWLDMSLSYFDDADNDSVVNILDSDSDNDAVKDWKEWTVWAYYHTISGFSATGRSGYTSDPTVIESDNDGMTDYAEITVYRTDPGCNDSDGDGLLDNLELSLTGSGDQDDNLTNPTLEDTDLDGLIDGTEDANKNGAVDSTETDPLDWDTDNDTLNDGFETLYPSIIDPLEFNNASLDDDNDGITTYGEMLNGTSPISSDTDSDTMDDKWEIDNNTNPLVDDADLDFDVDGLSNKEEYDGWSISTYRFSALNVTVNVTEYQVRSYPWYRDADGDGLYDSAEKEFATDPTYPDTDWDGLWDLFEAYKPILENDTTPAQLLFDDGEDWADWAITDLYVTNHGDIYFASYNESWDKSYFRFYNSSTDVVEDLSFQGGKITSIAGDLLGYIYYTKSSGSLVRYAPPGFDSNLGGVLTDELQSPTDIAIDEYGNVFIADEGTFEFPENHEINTTWEGTGNISKWNQSAGLTVLISGLNRTKSVAVDRYGDLIISEFGKIQRNYSTYLNYYYFGGKLSKYDTSSQEFVTLDDGVYYQSLNFDTLSDLYFVQLETPGNYTSLGEWPSNDTEHKVRMMNWTTSGGNPHLYNGTDSYSPGSGMWRINEGTSTVMHSQGRLYWANALSCYGTFKGLFRTNVTSNYTDASHWDTDNDSLPDGLEIYGWEMNITHVHDHSENYILWANTDNPEWFVYMTRSNPNSNDTENDGVKDYQEYTNYSDPRNNDTDDDGIDDFDELFTYRTLPYTDDSDNDMLADSQELGIQWDSDTSSTTNASNPDTDGDLIPDGVEDWNLDGEWDDTISAYNTETDPTEADSDDDGLNDSEEEYIEVFNAQGRVPVDSSKTKQAYIDPEETYGAGLDVSRYLHSATVHVGITGIEGKYLNITLRTNDTNQSINQSIFNGSEADNDTRNSTIVYLTTVVRGYSYYSPTTGPLWTFVPRSGYPNWSMDVNQGRDHGWVLDVNSSDPDSENEGQIEYFKVELRSATSPLDSDCDNDSLNDSEEVKFGTYGFISNPWRTFSDADDISDYDEVTGTGDADGFHTDPMNPDTDYDSFYDDDDINPLGQGVLEIEFDYVKILSTAYSDQEDGGSPGADVYFVVRVENESIGFLGYDSDYLRTIVQADLENGSDTSLSDTRIIVNIPDCNVYDFEIEIQLRDKDGNSYNIDDDDLLDITATDNDNDGMIDIIFDTETETWTGDTSSGNNTGSDAQINFDISLGLLPRINTILLLPIDGSYHYNATMGTQTTTDDIIRFTGINKFYIIDIEIENGAQAPFVDGINKIIIPQSVFFVSAFYNHTNNSLGSELSDLIYIDQDAQWVAPDSGKASDQYIVNSITLQYPNGGEATNPLMANWFLFNLTHNDTSDVGQNWTNVTAFYLDASYTTGEKLFIIGLPDTVISLIPYTALRFAVWDSEINDEDLLDTVGNAISDGLSEIGSVIRAGVEFLGDVLDVIIDITGLGAVLDVIGAIIDVIQTALNIFFESLRRIAESAVKRIFIPIANAIASYIGGIMESFVSLFIPKYRNTPEARSSSEPDEVTAEKEPSKFREFITKILPLVLLVAPGFIAMEAMEIMLKTSSGGLLAVFSDVLAGIIKALLLTILFTFTIGGIINTLYDIVGEKPSPESIWSFFGDASTSVDMAASLAAVIALIWKSLDNSNIPFRKRVSATTWGIISFTVSLTGEMLDKKGWVLVIFDAFASLTAGLSLGKWLGSRKNPVEKIYCFLTPICTKVEDAITLASIIGTGASITNHVANGDYLES